jgi:hypothetical protein
MLSVFSMLYIRGSKASARQLLFESCILIKEVLDLVRSTSISARFKAIYLDITNLLRELDISVYPEDNRPVTSIHILGVEGDRRRNGCRHQDCFASFANAGDTNCQCDVVEPPSSTLPRCMLFFNLVLQPIAIWHSINLCISKTEGKAVLIGSKLTNTQCWRYFQLSQFCSP